MMPAIITNRVKENPQKIAFLGSVGIDSRAVNVKIPSTNDATNKSVVAVFGSFFSNNGAAKVIASLNGSILPSSLFRQIKERPFPGDKQNYEVFTERSYAPLALITIHTVLIMI